MALIFMDGFDHYYHNNSGGTLYSGEADIFKKWTWWLSNTNDVALETGPRYARPPGGMGLRAQNGNGARGAYKVFSANYATFVVGTNLYFNGFLPGNAPIVSVYDYASGVPGGTTQLDIRGDSNGHLTITRNGTVLATSTNVVQANVWYHVELKATIHNTTGQYELRVNDSSTGWIPESSADKNTRGQSSNNYINAVGLSSGGNEVWFDDFYFLDTTGSVANSFIGTQKIVTIMPNAAGNSSQWAGNYAANFVNVNGMVGDRDLTFNQSATAGHIDLFAFGDIPAGDISGIQHNIMARQDTGVARTIRPKVRLGGTNYNGTTVSLQGGYVYVTEPVTLNPADSQAWETADINGAEFGYELVS
jgi:hypothetical protein